MKTIGTLEEIGAQVGDVVEWLGQFERSKDYIAYEVSKVVDGVYYHTNVGDYVNLTKTDPWRIVTKAAKSPIRTVTRKEIVPGFYGAVNVADTYGQWIELEFIGEYGHTGRPRLTASCLSAAIVTLTEIRDAMQDNY